MIPLSQAKKLLDIGYSLITVDDKKVPNFPWKEQQTEIIDKDKLEKQYSQQEDGNRKATSYLGYVTGFNNLEVIDVDLKIFSSLKEQNDFWNEFLQLLRDNIDDFDYKFTIYKTVNQGYHILYKTKRVQGSW